MTQEEKQLLLKDLCARLPYGVKAQVIGWDEEKGEVEVPLRIYSVNTDGYIFFETNDYDVHYLAVDDCSLYLRPMSSMTEEEKNNLQSLHDIISDENYEDGYSPSAWNAITEWEDYCNAKHLDYRGLIPKGLAIKAPEGMYNLKEE